MIRQMVATGPYCSRTRRRLSSIAVKFFVSLVLDRFLDQIRRASGVVDVDADETFFREIFCHVRAAVIERHAGAEEGVG